MTYRVALVGAGRTGRRHAQQWSQLPGVEIVGVLDPHWDAAQALGPAYGDWETLLAQARPDVIDVCAPTPQHRDTVERAAAAGKAVFVETPLAGTLADCEAIADAVDRAGLCAMPGHLLRYTPEYVAAKELVDAGGVGRPATVRTARLCGFPAGEGLEGGVILETLVPDFDWLRWTFGPVSRVFAKGLHRRQDVGGLDYALVTLRFASGVIGHVSGSWAHPGGLRTTLEVAGDGGLIEHDSARTALLLPDDGTAESLLAPTDDPCYRELAAFVSALKSGTPPPVTIRDAYEAVRVALAALESITTGKVVTL